MYFLKDVLLITCKSVCVWTKGQKHNTFFFYLLTTFLDLWGHRCIFSMANLEDGEEE